MARINPIAEAGVFNINQAQGRYGKSAGELSTGNRNLSRDISSSIIVGQLDNKSQTIRKVREGLMYMKNMFATAHTGTQNLLNNLTEQQNLIRAAGNSASPEVLTQLKTALDGQISSFIRIVKETSFDGRQLLNGSGAAGGGGMPAGVVANFSVVARMGVAMGNSSIMEITCLHPSQIYTRTNFLETLPINGGGVAILNAGTAASAAIRDGLGIDGAERATVALGCDAGNGSLAVIRANLSCQDANNTPKIDSQAHREASETAINAARASVSAQNAKIESYLAIIEDAMNSLGEDLITNNSAVASLANTDYMQSSEESKNALQAMLSGMAVLSTFQAQLNRAILEVIKS